MVPESCYKTHPECSPSSFDTNPKLLRMAPWINGLVAISAIWRAASYDSVVQNVTISNIEKVRSNLVEIASARSVSFFYPRSCFIHHANHSWELGTATEALLELSWPSLSIFNSSSLPPPPVLNATLTPTEVLEIANRSAWFIFLNKYTQNCSSTCISSRTVSQRPADSLALIANQGSAADPAST